jgi:enoyl-CoA hydratase
MAYNTILTDVKNGVLKITLNRPEKYNAITNELWNELRDALEHASEDGDVRALIITGAGKAFCAGGDVDGLKAGFGGHIGFL